MSEERLDQARARIDELDVQIQEAVSERALIAQDVARIKAEMGGGPDCYRPAREAEVLRRVIERNKGPLTDTEIARVMREIMSACLSLESPLRVAYLGPEGTYTQAAVYKHFGSAVQDRALAAIDEIFRDVEAGNADYGVVPVENSTEGVVNHTLDMFATSSLLICGEVSLPVHHHLLARSTDLDKVERVYAHAQSFAQCRKWLDRKLPGAERHAVSSNGEAARIVAEGSGAAIAGKAAAGRYGLQILAANIEDEPDNTTRFLVIGRQIVPPTGNDMTSILLSSPNRPGALYDLLRPFADAGLDLTRIESRPSRRAQWDYNFFVDILGHAEDAGIKDSLAEVRRTAAFFKLLGSYPPGGDVMSVDFVARAAPGVRKLKAYEPGKPIEELERELGISDIIKLASNENPLGPSPAVSEALASARDIARYPDGSGHRLKSALSAQLDVAIDRITLGNGSNDVLELLARVFLQPGLNAVCSAHAFAVYPLATLAAGGELREVPARVADDSQAYGHDLARFAEFVDADTRLLFIANPNNPTGTWVEPAEIESLLGAVPGDVVVVLDEAYHEYQEAASRPDSLALLSRHENLVITRTFSKVYGLAALRVGYSLSSPQIADLLNRVRQPFNNNSHALAGAEAALGDQDHVARSVAENAAGRDYLISALSGMGLSALPSQANFLSFDFGRPAQPVFDALLREGVIVRPLAGYKLPNHLRITVGTQAENRRCVEALARVLGTD